MEIKHGMTRTVILTKGYAIKLPSIRYSLFIEGVVANWREVMRSGAGCYCPVLFSVVLVNVMPRLREVTPEEFEPYKNCLPDPKPENYGWFNGGMVAIDYGHP